MTSSADRTPEDASSRKNSDKREKSKEEDSRSSSSASSSHKIGKASSSSSISSTSLGNTFGSKTDCRGKKSPKREDELSDREDWNRLEDEILSSDAVSFLELKLVVQAP